MHALRGRQRLRRYLHALKGLRDSPFLARCKRTTRLRLQAELYSLTQARACFLMSAYTWLVSAPVCLTALRFVCRRRACGGKHVLARS